MNTAVVVLLVAWFGCGLVAGIWFIADLYRMGRVAVGDIGLLLIALTLGPIVLGAVFMPPLLPKFDKIICGISDKTIWQRRHNEAEHS